MWVTSFQFVISIYVSCFWFDDLWRLILHVMALALIHSCLDYCNGLLSGLPAGQIARLHGVLRSSATARLVLSLPSRASVSAAMHDTLCWLDFPQRITYKLTLLLHLLFTWSGTWIPDDSVRSVHLNWLTTPPLIWGQQNFCTEISNCFHRPLVILLVGPHLVEHSSSSATGLTDTWTVQVFARGVIVCMSPCSVSCAFRCHCRIVVMLLLLLLLLLLLSPLTWISRSWYYSMSNKCVSMTHIGQTRGLQLKLYATPRPAPFSKAIFPSLTACLYLLDSRDREWCLHQSSKHNFGLLWPWPLTYWPHGRPFMALPQGQIYANLQYSQFIRFRSIAFTSW